MAWRFFTVAVLAAAFSTADHSHAYPAQVDYSGEVLRWDISKGNPEVLFEVKSASDDAVAAYQGLIEGAAALWTEVPTSYLEFRMAAADEEAQVTVELDTDFADAAFSSGYAVFDEDDGDHPGHCTIKIDIPDLGITDVDKTALHELGHCVGLGHSLIPEAIMSYEDKKNAFALDIDDAAAISRLYPVEAGSDKLPPGCAVGSAVGKTPATAALLYLLLALPVITVRFRRQARQSPTWG